METETHKKIKNKNYRKFLDKGEIDPLSEEDIILVLDNIKKGYIKEGRSLVICMYYTGARPNEVLRIKARDVERNKNYITVKVKGSKKGLPRIIYLPFRLKLVKEFYGYACSMPEDYILFWHFKGNYKRTTFGKNGVKENTETTYKLRYYFEKWFGILPNGSVPPYFLRHNRFSKLALKGAAMQDLKMLKGSKTFASIEPYLHMSAEKAKKVGRLLE